MPRRGSLHHKAKLTEEQVKAIREEYAEGDTSHWKLALKYDVDSAATIAAIVHRRTWTHV
jgi:cyclopropane fatty-acyl-phospholipid synthase-like methyltransferase